MSETAPEATQDGNNSGATSAAEEFKPITSQDDLNRIIGERVKRATSKYADYDDLKAKAGQLDALSEASKSEQDKLTDRIAKLENEIETTRLTAARAEIAREFGLNEKQAAALKYAPSAEAAREIAEGLAADSSDRKKHGPRVPSEGQHSSAKADPTREFLRGLTGSA